MAERITVAFTRAEYDAALAELRRRCPDTSRKYFDGPTLYMADLQDAVRRMENADRPLKIVS